jgi:hypothetical protein
MCEAALAANFISLKEIASIMGIDPGNPFRPGTFSTNAKILHLSG